MAVVQEDPVFGVGQACEVLVFQMSMDLPRRTHLGMLQGLFDALSKWLDANNVPLSEAGAQLHEWMKDEQNDMEEVQFHGSIPQLVHSIQVRAEVGCLELSKGQSL